jgi:hypothetical protein
MLFFASRVARREIMLGGDFQDGGLALGGPRRRPGGAIGKIFKAAGVGLGAGWGVFGMMAFAAPAVPAAVTLVAVGLGGVGVGVLGGGLAALAQARESAQVQARSSQQENTIRAFVEAAARILGKKETLDPDVFDEGERLLIQGLAREAAACKTLADWDAAARHLGADRTLLLKLAAEVDAREEDREKFVPRIEKTYMDYATLIGVLHFPDEGLRVAAGVGAGAARPAFAATRAPSLNPSSGYAKALPDAKPDPA